MQNNRREIKPPQDEVEEETKTKGSKDDKDDIKNDSIDQVCLSALGHYVQLVI
jgi:hypothetical protein